MVIYKGMEIIKVKNREFNLIETIDDDCFVCERKNSKYFVRKFDYSTDEGQMLSFQIKKLSNTGIKMPKLYFIDKKNGYIVSEYIEGTKLINIISEKDVGENIIEQLFKNEYLAKINKMTLNYEPDKWILRDNTIYYTYPIFIKFDENKDLPIKYLPLYFNTRACYEFLKNKGVFYDKNRIKTDFDTNKEMVLTTCKYYR